MKLTYIYHSGYLIECDNFSVLIDYYEDTSFSPQKGYVHNLLRQEKPLYILSTHSHADHFNPEVLIWKELKENITYIFSYDILEQKKVSQEKVFFLKKGEQFTDANLQITAFGSTDIGISFLIETARKTIFHAGDLNNWHWKEESTKEEILTAENNYLCELSLLANHTKNIDLAMFPVDPRLGNEFDRGARQFIDNLHIGIFAPMHFGEDIKVLSSFRSYAEKRGVHFVNWEHRGDSLTF